MCTEPDLTMEVTRFLPGNKTTATGSLTGTAAFIAECVEIELGIPVGLRILIVSPVTEEAA